MSGPFTARYIVIDPAICHGQPVFRGTRIFVTDILAQLADGIDSESIIEEWHSGITQDAISEALQWADRASLECVLEYIPEPVSKAGRQ